MPRRVVEDIVRSEKRSVRNIGEKETRRATTRSKPSRASLAEEEVAIHRVKTPPREIEESEEPAPSPKKKAVPPVAAKNKKVGGKLRGIWLYSGIGVVLVVVISAYVASAHFSRAKFVIAPITIPFNITNSTIVATATSSPGYLRYEIVPYTAIATTTVVAVDGPYISSKASGAITIYNSYSKSPQRLIAGTRFVNNVGQIYRLTSSIVIPGAVVSTKGATTSGSIVAAIMADQPGAEYGMVRSSQNELMRIASYEGGPRYTTIYGKLKTDVSGGYVGTRKTINPAQLASTTKELQAALTEKLKTQSKNALRDGYITYDNAYTISFLPVATGGTGANQATVSVTGTLYSIVFKKTDLVSKLAGPNKLIPLGTSPYKTTGLEDMTFTITNPNTFDPKKGNALIARLNGRMTVTGIVPVEELRAKLAGLKLPDTKNILMSYSTVVDMPKSSGELFPSWSSTVPKDLSRISIVIEE